MEEYNVTEQKEPTQETDSVKESKKHLSKVGWMYCFFTVMMLGVQSATFWIANTINPELVENPNISLLLSLMPFYVLGVPSTVYLLKKFVPAEEPEQHSMKVSHMLLAVMMMLTLFLGFNIAGNILTGIISIVKPAPVNNAILDIVLSINPVLNIFCTVICAPIIEEYIFRKLLIDRTKRYGQGAAIWLSGMMFGLFHGNINQFMYAFAVGVLFAFIYTKTGKIQYSMILHAILNLVSGVIAPALLNGINLEAYMAAAASGDQNLLLETMMASLPQWIAYIAYMFCYFAVAVTGLVLLIVFRKKFKVEHGEHDIPKGKRFATWILNPGMAVYFVFWIGLIIWNICA